MITVSTDTAQLSKAIASFKTLAGDSSSLTRKVADQVQANIAERFVTQTDPSGIPWKPLKPSTIREKTSKGYPAAILTRTGALQRSIDFQINGEEIVFTSNLPYAAKQNATRQFLGVSPLEEERLAILVLDLLSTKI
jgi:phage gpG-like protein